MYRSALFGKKTAKVHKYSITQGGKKYKKYLISKKFREDEAGKGKHIPKKDKDALNAKLLTLYTKQSADIAGAENVGEVIKTGLELIQEIDESYLSDLRPEDIPDDCVSEPDMDALENDANATDAAKGNLMTAQADIDAQAEEENRKFL